MIPGIPKHGLLKNWQANSAFGEARDPRSYEDELLHLPYEGTSKSTLFVSAFFNLIGTDQTTSLNQNRKGRGFRSGSHYQKVNLKSQVLEAMTSAKCFPETQMKLGNMDVADVQTPEQNPDRSPY